MAGIFGNIGQRLSPLWAGQADPRLSQGANAAAGQAGLTASGLATIMASAPGGLTPAAAIAAGLLQGQQAAGASRGAALSQQQQEEMRAAVANAGPGAVDAMQAAFMQAIITGDSKLASALSGVLPAAYALQGGRGTPRVTRNVTMKGPDGVSRIYVQDSSTGEVVRELGEPGDTGASTAADITALGTYTGEDGKEFFGGFSRSAGRIVPIRGAAAEAGTTGQERMNARLAEGARRANEDLNRLDEQLTSMTTAAARSSNPLARMAGNALSSDMEQQAVTAGRNFIQPVVRFLSGAQMTEMERVDYANALLPAPFDKPETIAFKRRMRANILETISKGESADAFIQANPLAYVLETIESGAAPVNSAGTSNFQRMMQGAPDGS